MKRLILILILTFSFQTLAKADDIRDFEIEGMSIGDSLLDYFSKEQINLSINKNSYKDSDRKFTALYTGDIKDHEVYDYMRVHILTKDKKFKIYGISGMIDYKKKDIQKCYSLQKNIEKEFDKTFSSYDKWQDKFKSMYDKTGKSFITSIYYETNLGIAKISCYDFSSHVKYPSGIDVTINTKEFSDWLISIRK